MLVLKADGRTGAGSGHLGRCLALAQAWMDHGGHAVLVPPADPSPWVDRYSAEGVEIGSGPDVPPGADWVVLDGYRYDRADQEQAATAGRRLLVIDDHATVGTYELADVILDQNLGASPAGYSTRSQGADLLLGLRFALLRREFRRVPDRARPTQAQARTITVMLGGSPPEGAVRLVETALAQVAGTGIQPVWLAGVGEVVPAMAAADLALSASGSTCWELCRMGVPALLLPLADNQLPLARALDNAGAARCLRPFDALHCDDLAAAIIALAGDADGRDAMSEHGRRIVDGRGAARVAARLRADLLTLRPVLAEDRHLLWEWANDPTVRASAFSSAPIPWDEHVSWFAASMADPGRRNYVAAAPGGGQIGQIRFDIERATAIVGVSVASAHRGAGWGAALIDAGVRRLLREAAVDVIEARVKPGNAASLAAFDTAGFTVDGTGADGDSTWVRLSRPRQPVAAVTAHAGALGNGR